MNKKEDLMGGRAIRNKILIIAFLLIALPFAHALQTEVLAPTPDMNYYSQDCRTLKEDMQSYNDIRTNDLLVDMTVLEKERHENLLKEMNLKLNPFYLNLPSMVLILIVIVVLGLLKATGKV